MSINITNRDIIWGYTGVIMTLGSNLFLLPFLLNRLPGDELGLWYTFLAIGNIANLFDFGFKPTIARNITYAWTGARQLKSYGAITIEEGQNTNFELLNTVMEASKKIYFVISSTAGIFLITIGSVYILKISEKLDAQEVIIAWILYAIAVFLNLYFGYLAAFLTGIGALAESNKANVTGRMIQFIIALILLMLGMGILSVSIAYLTYGIIFRQCAKVFLYQYDGVGRKLKQYSKNIAYRDIINIFKIVWPNAWRDGLVSFASYLNGQVSTLLCSWFLNLEDTAVYGLSRQLAEAIAAVSCVYFSTYQSKMQSSFISGDIKTTKKVFSTAMMVYYILYIVGAVFLCTAGIPLLGIMKSNIKLSIPFLAVLLVYVLFYKNQVLHASYISGTNRIPYMKGYLISGTAVVVFSLTLLVYTDWGIWSLALAPLITESLYNYWKWPQFVLHELEMGMFDVARYGTTGIKNIFHKKEIAN